MPLKGQINWGDQIIGEVFGQGLGEGKSHKYSVQYYPAQGKTMKNVEKPPKESKNLKPPKPLNLVKKILKPF